MSAFLVKRADAGPPVTAGLLVLSNKFVAMAVGLFNVTTPFRVNNGYAVNKTWLVSNQGQPIVSLPLVLLVAVPCW